jgi:intein/homing endonuclease
VPVAKLIRHKVSKPQYKITTSSGKHVIVTGDHSCIIVDGTGNIHSIKASEIKINDKVIEI